MCQYLVVRQSREAVLPELSSRPTSSLSSLPDPSTRELSGMPILCLDFDGVCHSYVSGWRGVTSIPDPPVDGLFPFLEQALRLFRVAIYSTRSEREEGRSAMRMWFAHWAEQHYNGREEGATFADWLLIMLEFPVTKPAALVTLDDRAVTFRGDWPDVGMLRGFRVWNEHLIQRRKPNSEKDV